MTGLRSIGMMLSGVVAHLDPGPGFAGLPGKLAASRARVRLAGGPSRTLGHNIPEIALAALAAPLGLSGSFVLNAASSSHRGEHERTRLGDLALLGASVRLSGPPLSQTC